MSSPGDGVAAGPDLDRPLPLHPLVYLEEGEEVTVGRVDIDSYAVFPADGAELLRSLADGVPPREVARCYEAANGEGIDMLDLLSTLDELGFVRAASDPAPVIGTPPVRWQRLGQVLFSRPALACYLLVAVLGTVETIRVPQLAPRPSDLFFTSYFTLIELTLYLGQIVFLLVHEGFHALAGRRLGVSSKLSVSHRLMFVVLETSLDGLVTVPRRKRYLPILAGMLADVLVAAVLTLVADLTRNADGALSFGSRLCLALAYSTLLRLAWQALLYLRTDVYVLLSTFLHCHDLHGTASGLLRNAVRRVLGRPLMDESAWHPSDRRAARWYVWLMLAGYALTIVLFAEVAVPVGYRFIAGVFDRFTGHAQLGPLLDSVLLLALTVGQLLAAGVVAARDRRRARPAPATVLG